MITLSQKHLFATSEIPSPPGQSDRGEGHQAGGGKKRGRKNQREMFTSNVVKYTSMSLILVLMTVALAEHIPFCLQAK